MTTERWIYERTRSDAKYLFEALMSAYSELDAIAVALDCPGADHQEVLKHVEALHLQNRDYEEELVKLRRQSDG